VANGAMYDLNKLVLTNSGWTLQVATAINDSGQIVGWGTNSSNQTHAFLLNPVPLGWRDAIKAQPSIKTYGTCPAKQSGKDSLIEVTHGWSPKVRLIGSPPDQPWVDQMTNAIGQYLTNSGLNNWQVAEYKWLTNAWKLNPEDALNNAKQEGLKLGNCISTQGWSHVHLIGHSAGAGLIQAASEVIKSNSPTTTVHCTFLDMYLGFDTAGLINYGNGTDWSDSYFSRDVETGWLTEGSLTNAYNIDVTQLDSHKVPTGVYWSAGTFQQCIITESAHGWPVDFYSNTITGTVPSSYQGFGFPLSKEGGNWNYATNYYKSGNATPRVLGNSDPACSQLLYNKVFQFLGTGTDKIVDYIALPVVQSATGNIQRLINGSIHLFTGSPAWIAAVVSSTTFHVSPKDAGGSVKSSACRCLSSESRASFSITAC